MTTTRSIAVCTTLALTLFGACSRRPAAPRGASASDNKPAPAVAHASMTQTSADANGAASPQTLPPGHPPLTGTGAGVKVDAPIEPAKGGTTVEGVWKARKTLTGRSVTVRGKVVKFTGGVLGVNWLHLQDGTGSAADGTNDITVTSDAQANVGDVVTVTGTVTLNKDLGSGYNYPVLIERAQIAAK